MEKLIEALRSGAYRIDACRAAGIHYNTLLAWEKNGQAQKRGEFSDFLDALRRAEADAAVKNVEIITRAAQDGDWRAAAWFLEHKYPDKWARLEKRAVEQDGEQVQNGPTDPTDDDKRFRRFQQALAEALAPYPEARIAISKAIAMLDDDYDGDSRKDH
jgi:hypothetical protein